MKRPFRGLSPVRGPDEAYDAVVIGAGVGGLTCAALLAKQGLSVLLAERHTVVGGLCSTFRRNGFVFDAASHFYPLLGNPQTITGRLLRDLGSRTRWIKMDPVDRFHLPDGAVFEVPADFDTYLAKLTAEFPDERSRIVAFFEQVKRCYLLGIHWYFRDGQAPDLGALARATVGERIRATFQDPRLRLVLTADCPHWGSPPSRTSYVFDCMLRYSYFLGNFYPEGGSQAFADDLARCFEENGGHILLHAPVTRILTSGRAACGVELETGPIGRRRTVRVRAGAVVSNADYHHTAHALLDDPAVAADYQRAAHNLRPTYPCFLMYLGLRGVTSEQLRAVHGYHWRSYDFDAVGKDAFLFKLFVPTLYEPAMAPPGGHVLIVQKVTDIDYDAISDWLTHKAGLERFVLEELRHRASWLLDAIVVRDSASARTAFRYTGNHAGAMLGWEMAPDQLGERRPGVMGPLRNLFLVGHWTRPGGGITPVIVSAMRAAQAIAGRTSETAAEDQNWTAARVPAGIVR